MKTALRRSALFVPGDSSKMIRGAAATASDILILNLEDGVSLSRKDSARENVVMALKDLDFGGRETVVRINALDTAMGIRDLAAVVPSRPDGICLPKINKASEIQAADRAISNIEIQAGLPEGTVKLHVLIESAAGLLQAAEIAAASPRMASLVFGLADYLSDVRCRPGEDRQELLLALQMIVTSARSAGIDAIDAPCFDIRNLELLRRESVQARRYGFDGKSALHPEQCAVINEIFDVTAEEIAWAERVLSGLDEAEDRGRALTTMEGVLIDNPHRAAAERILRRRPPR